MYVSSSAALRRFLLHPLRHLVDVDVAAMWCVVIFIGLLLSDIVLIVVVHTSIMMTICPMIVAVTVHHASILHSNIGRGVSARIHKSTSHSTPTIFLKSNLGTNRDGQSIS